MKKKNTESKELDNLIKDIMSPGFFISLIVITALLLLICITMTFFK